MSDAQPGAYGFDYTGVAKTQLKDIAAVAKGAGMYDEFIRILKEAVERMKTDPQGWGDPEFHSRHVDALYCHAMIRPLCFRFVIFERARGVVLLSVRLYAEFD